MLRACFRLWVGCGLMLLAGGWNAAAWAAEKDKAPAAESRSAESPTSEGPTAETPVPADPAEIDRLVEQLDADAFAVRQKASQRLAELGKAAIPALAAAIPTGGRETLVRAIDLLKRQLQSGDDAAKAAARQTLEKIAQGENAVAARHAEQALQPKPPVGRGNGGPQLGGFPNGGIQLGGQIQGQVQIQVQMAAGGAQQVQKLSIQVVNGVKTIEAQENGRKVKIHDDPAQGIKMEIVETKDGKETTSKYEAKTEDDLKKKHPDAHKLYEKYAKNRAQMQIQIGGFAVPPAPPPMPAP